MSESSSASASDAHPLPAAQRWSFWFDRYSSDTTFEASIQELTSFASVEGFWRTYCHLARPSALGNGDNYHVFRGDRPPAWEAMPNCGTWLHRLDRASPWGGSHMPTIPVKVPSSLLVTSNSATTTPSHGMPP